MSTNINLATFTNEQGFTITGVGPGAFTGYSVSKVGDINNDGYDDIIIGAPCYVYSLYVCQGRAYVIYGGKSLSDVNLARLTAEQGFTITGGSGKNYFAGWSVGAAGDVNGDGYADIIIGEPGYNNNAGISYVIFGGKSLSNIGLGSLTNNQGIYILGAFQGDNSGGSVNGAGDVNNDGFDDVIIGAPDARILNETARPGAVYVIYGGKNITNISLINLYSSSSTQGFHFQLDNRFDGDGLGYSVSGISDFNKDGYDDVIIGAPFASSGASYILYGDNIFFKGFTIVYSTWIHYRTGGLSVSKAGDVNGDGYSDVIIGAPGTYYYTGAAYVIYGTNDSFNNVLDMASLSITQGFSIIGFGNDSFTGFSVSTAGDLNKDGYSDIIVGSPQCNKLFDSTPCTGGGMVYTVYGGSALTNTNLINMTASQGFSITGVGYESSTGYFVNTAGDFNNDSYDDIIIGAPFANENRGEAYVVYGSASGFYTFPPTTSPTKQHDSLFNEEWWNSLEFKLVTTLGIPVLSFITAWFFREKIAFHILSNWGYQYKLLDNSDTTSTSLGTVGFYLSYNKQTNTNDLLCIIRDKKVKVVIDNGNNNGIPEGLYNELVTALESPLKKESFVFFHSEENKIRDFLLSRNLFDANDLGFFKGRIYKLILNTDYRSKYNDKYQDEARHSDISRLSHIHSATGNPMNDQESVLEMRESGANKDIESGKIDNISSVLERQSKDLTDKQGGSVILSIDAMVDPLHVQRQDEEFKRFSKNLAQVTKELLFLKSSASGSDDQAVSTFHEKTPVQDNMQFSAPENLMISLLNTRQIVEYIPIVKYLAQSAINNLGYNVTLPEVLDNKAILATAHLILGNTAAQFLPVEFITTGTIISSLGSGAYAIRLIAADYLKEQQPADKPVDIIVQCGTSVLLYNLPNIMTYIVSHALLPISSYSISSYDILTSSSFGAIHCSSNYKPTISQQSEITTTDIAIPLIVDVGILLLFGNNIKLDTSSINMLTMSIKNCMNLAATIYAADSVARMAVNFIPQEIKSEYVEPLFDLAYETTVNGVEKMFERSNVLVDYVVNEELF